MSNQKIIDVLYRYLPWFAVGLTVLYFGYRMMPQRAARGEFNFHDFGRFPVLEKGRYKPMDTVARTNLMIIAHRQAYYDPDRGTYHSANKWLLDVMTSPASQDSFMKSMFPTGAANHPAWDYKVFRIENEELVRTLNLKWRDGLRYSINEINGNNENIGFLEAESKRIGRLEGKDRSLVDSKVMELAGHLHIAMELSSHFAPLVVPDENGGDTWKPFRIGIAEHIQKIKTGEADETETARVYLELLRKYDAGEKAEFNDILAKHLTALEKQKPSIMRAINLEVFFNEFAPFYHCLGLYVFIAIGGCLSWLIASWSKPIREAAFASMGVVFLVHTAAILIRMYLQGRAPVTNLYSSAIFIGWGCVAACLAIEWIYQNGIAVVVGSVTGFCTLIIAHILSLDGDTMEMLVAVLDTNFWLATHVTCITLGYTTTFVAGFMGIAYILLGIFTNMLRKEGSATLTRMTYGVLCTGMFLSFVGTVLGGLWADYSWGRFWGWDPKENGALLIVIWIAMILHSRWGGLVKHRGIAVLSVLGIIVTSWSWFGTNFLGYGLHSYGRRDGAMATLVMIDLGFAAIAGLGCMPLKYWQSFRPLSTMTGPSGGPGPSTPATLAAATSIAAGTPPQSKKAKPKLA